MVPRDSHLRFVSISHRTAPVASRENYYLPEAAKAELTDMLTGCFPDLSSLLMLVTCNRSEIYFESVTTTAAEVRDTFLKFVQEHTDREERRLFITGERTEGTIKHLLRVAAGLESSVLGDAEILHQVKKAYHFSLERGLQGSLLERAVQTVFRSHKRISNETAFRDGTTSTAYKALKLVGGLYRTEAHDKKILLVGAGDIVQQLLKYNSKFEYQNIWITNRTEARITPLAKRYGLKVFPWKSLLEGQLTGFDVIISAVSNRSALISGGLAKDRQLLLVDLAVPGNFDPDLQKHSNVLYSDLDNITSHLEENKASRLKATVKVEQIIQEEWKSIVSWYHKQPLRELLANRKSGILEILRETRGLEDVDTQELEILADQIIRKMLKDPESLKTTSDFREKVKQLLPTPTN